jgi:pimeloyl-ACP methyl ester carboxylesterase
VTESRDTSSEDGRTAPPWFLRAVAQLPRHGDVEVRGARVHYRSWEGPGGPDLLLVHGAAAHSGWWDHLAPRLDASRVVAVDLSGHGDSGHRAEYDMADWVDEVVAVASAAELRRPVLVGHSMGGRAALTTAIQHSASVRAVVCIDIPLDRGRRTPAVAADPTPPRRYATVEEAVSRFRTRPATEAPAWLRRHIARESVRPAAGGWTWKADQGVFSRGRSMRELLPLVTVPVVLLRAERGLVPAAMAAEMAALAPRGLTVVELPDCGHHPMLDAPLTVLAALRTLFAVWPDAGPPG